VSEMLDAALFYASKGIAVFPCWHVSGTRCGCGNPGCKSPGKHPLLPHGLKGATTDPAVIKHWWGGCGGPEPNIGGVCGPSFTIIDEDEPGALLASGLDIPNGPAQKTGRGQHFIFQVNGYEIPNRVRFAPGLDVRGTGGYVLLAPSLHVSGARYAWVNGHSLDDLERPHMPEAAVQLILSAKPGANSAGHANGHDSAHDLFGKVRLEELLRSIEQMPRAGNGGLWRERMLMIVGSLVGRRLPDDVILAICRRATWLDAGYSHEDTEAWVQDCIASTRRAWDVPPPDEDNASFNKIDGEAAQAADPSDLCLTPTQWAARTIPPEDLLLGSLFSTTTRSQFSADTGLGKTMFGLGVGFAMGLGADFLHWQGRRPARVLIHDGEMPGELIKSRLASAAEWFDGQSPDDLFLLSREDVANMPPLDTPEGAVWLLDFIEKLGGIDFGIFDNIAALTTGCLKEEEGAQAVKNLQRDLTARRIGQLWLHHTGHDASRGYGAKMREWWLDTAMVAEKLDQPGTDVSFTLKFPKCRRRTPDNRADFDEVEVALADGSWTTSAAPQRQGRSQRLSKTARLCMAALTKALETLGRTPPYSSATAGVVVAVTLDEGKDFFARTSPYTDVRTDPGRKAFDRGSEQLLSDRFAVKWCEWVWLP